MAASNDVVDLQRIYEEEIKKMNTLLWELYEVSSANQLDGDKEEIHDVQRRHDALLQLAKVRIMKVEKPPLLPNNETLLSSLVLKRTKDEAKNSEATLEMLKKKVSELSEKKSVVQKYRAEEEHALNLLMQEGEEMGIIDPNSGAVLEESRIVQPSEKLAELRERLRLVRKLKNRRMMQMSDFVTKYFPALNVNEEAEMSDDIYQANDSFPPPISLGSILEMLVLEYLNDSRSHWVNITPSMWQPHIEFLLRSGIALRNSSNPSQMRLQHF